MRVTVNRFAQLPGVVTSLTKVTVGVLQLSEAVTAEVLNAGTADAHCTVTAAGQEMVGGVVSATLTVFEHVPEQPLESVVESVNVNDPLQIELAATETVCVELEPTIVPLPVTDQLYEAMPAGPEYEVVDDGHTVLEPVTLHVELALTVNVAALEFVVFPHASWRQTSNWPASLV